MIITSRGCIGLLKPPEVIIGGGISGFYSLFRHIWIKNSFLALIVYEVVVVYIRHVIRHKRNSISCKIGFSRGSELGVGPWGWVEVICLAGYTLGTNWM